MSGHLGIVLGAGGLLGAAWTMGALHALAEVEGVDPRQADALVGTSAGAVTAAFLAAGVGVDAMLRHQRGVIVPGDLRVDYDYDTGSGGALPPRPHLRFGSTSLLRRAARKPWTVTPIAALASVLPLGRGSVTPIGAVIDALLPAGGWAPHPATWIVAMDYDTGRRVPLGRAGSPPAGLADAVMASCAIPGWYAPVVIDGRRYVDGGTCSATSVDLLAGAGLDEVVVLAPMASFDYDTPASVGARLERRFRRLVTKRMLRETAQVRRAGTAVTLLTPGAEDLAAMGANLMDPRRREHVLETSLRTTQALLRDRGAGLAEAG